MHCNLSYVLAVLLFVCLITPAAATTIGPGTTLPGTFVFDALPVTQVAYAAPVVLNAGTYNIADFEVYTNANGGVVVPFLATYSTAPNDPSFTTLWVGPDLVGDGLAGVHTVNYSLGTQQFTVGSTTNLYAGTWQDGAAGVGTTLTFNTKTAAGISYGHPGPAGSVIGFPVAFTFPDLTFVSPRTYAYAIHVEVVVPPTPEPSSLLL